MSLAEGQRVEVIAEYGADQAGELVGWSHFEIDPKDVIFGSICYARVGENGAHLARIVEEETGQTLTTRDSNRGFTRQVSFEFNAIESKDQLPKSIYVEHARGLNILGYPSPQLYDEVGFARLMQRQPEPGKGRLGVGEEEILKSIKEQLTEQDIAWLYSTIYYNLAYLADERDVLADPEMSAETIQGGNQASEYLQTLTTIRREDESMALNLTVFGSLNKSLVPMAFADSRRRVAQAEQNLTKVRQQSVINSWQLPIGFRPSGRSWPYMDAMARTENEAFGRELEAIRRQDTAPASTELNRELNELGYRLEVAAKISGRLGLLATKELAKAAEALR